MANYTDMPYYTYFYEKMQLRVACVSTQKSFFPLKIFVCACGSLTHAHKDIFDKKNVNNSILL